MINNPINIEKFQFVVNSWFDIYGRDFPWRRTTNPYNLIIAESLLRQTQAERVEKPYLELIERYPDLQSMAHASVNQLRIWFQPLGLIRRADFLIETAKLILNKYSGIVPNDLGILLSLPGLGDYSARAVLCLAYGGSVAMIDEGIGRVYRRVLGKDNNKPAYSDHHLRTLVEEFIPPRSSRKFNLGILDIAKLCCHIRDPRCLKCPINEFCQFQETSKNSRNTH